METFEPAFEPEFSRCLEELKQLLDTMGSIHDFDVNLPRLQGFLREIRYFNRRTRNGHDRIPTSSLVKLIRSQSENRRQLFARMVLTFEQWERNDFSKNLLQSMYSESAVKD